MFAVCCICPSVLQYDAAHQQQRHMLHYRSFCCCSRCSSSTASSSVVDALQHAATHCNTLQHAATRCNTLQHDRSICFCSRQCISALPSSAFDASQHNKLQHAASHCTILQPTAIHTYRNTHLHDTATHLRHDRSFCCYSRCRGSAASSVVDAMQHTTKSTTRCNTIQHCNTHLHDTATHLRRPFKLPLQSLQQLRSILLNR